MMNTLFSLTVLRCPNCAHPLTGNLCPGCDTTFPSTLGILDLRWPQPAEQNPRLTQLIEKLVNHYEQATFQELVELRYQNNRAPAPLQEAYKHYHTSLQARGEKMLDMFERRLGRFFNLPGQEMALDLGCGVGAGSVILSRQYKWVIGLDPSLVSLLLARKFLAEKNIQNVFLVQGVAQNIPLYDHCIDYCVAQNVIEHLFEIEPAFAELHRVLKAGGCFCGDSRNRYDLFLPEPHAQLRWVGYWPRHLQPWYVRKFRNANYDSAYLLSFNELHKHARRVFGSSAKVVFPSSVAYGRSPKWDRITGLCERIPIVRQLMLAIYPSHLLIAQAN